MIAAMRDSMRARKGASRTANSARAIDGVRAHATSSGGGGAGMWVMMGIYIN
jgi:hypothetical protein